VTARPVERARYAIGALPIVGGLVHLGVLLATGGTWPEGRPCAPGSRPSTLRWKSES
jgi:hypothetical protein